MVVVVLVLLAQVYAYVLYACVYIWMYVCKYVVWPIHLCRCGFFSSMQFCICYFCVALCVLFDVARCLLHAHFFHIIFASIPTCNFVFFFWPCFFLCYVTWTLLLTDARHEKQNSLFI